MAAMPTEIAAHLRWLRHFGEDVPAPRRLRVEVVERQVFRARLHHGHTQAFFTIDQPPISIREVRRRMRWLRHSRQTLLALIDGLSADDLWLGTPRRKGRRAGKGGGGWTVWLYLRHVAGVEKWYLSQFWRNLPRLPRSDSVFHRLTLTRRQVVAVMRGPAPADLSRRMRTSGELWTVRKVLRRLLYHERYHMRTIARLMLGAGWTITPWVRSGLGIPALVVPLPPRVVRWPAER